MYVSLTNLFFSVYTEIKKFVKLTNKHCYFNKHKATICTKLTKRVKGSQKIRIGLLKICNVNNNPGCQINNLMF